MARYYTKEEKDRYLELFKERNDKLSDFAKEFDIPKSTLQGWIDASNSGNFGKIYQNDKTNNNKLEALFVVDNIRIELKENYNKETLKKLVEVICL